MTLLEEIAKGESATLEFKEARPKDSIKFTKTVVAFANGHGGRILFGVEDKTGRLVGVPRDKVAAEMDAIADAVANSCTPSVPMDIKPTTLDGKVLVALDVRSGGKTPYYVKSLGMRNGTFVRVGATTRGVEEHKLKSLILAGENLSFDRQPVEGGRVSRREVEAVCRTMTEVAKGNCRSDEERKAVKPMTEKRLVSMGLLLRKSGGLVPSYGFFIMSGDSASDLMKPKIKCGVFRGVAKGDFVDRRTCEGSVVSQINEAYAFLLRNLRVGSEIVGTQRRDVYEFPLDSIREAICNAVFHRDYLEPSSIYIALYDDRLEILSPGGLVKDFTMEDALNGFSKLRNNALGDALEYMKEVEAWGGGVSRYFTACAAAGLPSPTVTEESGFFKVVFWRKDSRAQDATPVTANTTPAVANPAPSAANTTPAVANTTPSAANTTPAAADTILVVSNARPLAIDATPIPAELQSRIAAIKGRAKPDVLQELIVSLCELRPFSKDDLARLLGREVGTVIKLITPLMGTRLCYLHPHAVHHPQQAYVAKPRLSLGAVHDRERT